MLELGKIQSRGQVTLPRNVRQRAGIKPGDAVTIQVVGPGTPLQDQDRLVWAAQPQMNTRRGRRPSGVGTMARRQHEFGP